MTIRMKTLITNALIVFLLGVACDVRPKDPVSLGNNTTASTNAGATPEPASTKPLEPVQGETQIGSPTPQLSPLPPDAKGVQSAIDVVQQYYRAINANDYRKAYELWSGKGEASGKNFEEFRDGFANTASTSIDTGGEPGNIEGAAGSQYVAIPGVITARTKDGKPQRFWGEYVMRRSMVDGATAEQRAWRIYSAKFRKL